MYKNYGEKEKDNLIEQIKSSMQNGESFGSACKKINIPRNTIYPWIKEKYPDLIQSRKHVQKKKPKLINLEILDTDVLLRKEMREILFSQIETNLKALKLFLN
jgi:transposase